MDKLAGLRIGSSIEAAPSPDSRLFALFYGRPKVGKTSFTAGLDAITRKYSNKRSIIIACEQAEGGGLDRIADLDIPTVFPSNLFDLHNFLSALQDVDEYGGIIIDGLTEMCSHIIVPHIQEYISIKQKSQESIRDIGSMADDDYKHLPGALSKIMRDLVRLTRSGKHVVMNAGLREHYDKERKLIGIKPFFPGAQASTTVEVMVKTIGTLDLVRDRNGVEQLAVSVQSDSLHVRGDRTGMLPRDRPLKGDLLYLYEEYWVKHFKSKQTGDK